ncbi:MAG: eukaryotic translation initiation factor 4E [Chaenotheca gracillima]|nr:MAG: eukaryotic translation initiation factor 4E [Chaenotheca gracillima]
MEKSPATNSERLAVRPVVFNGGALKPVQGDSFNAGSKTVKIGGTEAATAESVGALGKEDIE